MDNKINNKNYFKKWACGIVFLLTGVLFIAQSYAASDTIVVYYSRTGKSEAVAKALSNFIGADIIQINDAKDRSGVWGFIGAAYDSQMGNYTQIEPAHIDFSKYEQLYLVTPIWNWKLSMPMRTLLHTVNLQGKKMTVVTTANIDIKKYDGYGDDAPFIKKFLRDYLRDNRKEMLSLAQSTKADIIHHFHIATEGMTPQQIEEATITKISKNLAARR